MRTAIVIVILIIAVIFVGGGINIGSRPIFGHIDALLGTTALMDLHQTLFSLLYRGETSMGSGLRRSGSDVERFQQAPAGFDKRKHYRQLDKASQN